MDKIPAVLVFFFLTLSSFAFGQEKQFEQLMQGTWVSSTDLQYTLIISNNSIIEKYNGNNVDTFKYTIEKYSCDTSYSKRNNIFYLKKIAYSNKSIFCYELNGVSNNYLSLTYSVNGKILLFRRKR